MRSEASRLRLRHWGRWTAGPMPEHNPLRQRDRGLLCGLSTPGEPFQFQNYSSRFSFRTIRSNDLYSALGAHLEGLATRASKGLVWKLHRNITEVERK